jgi:hypothetical protein
MKFALSKVVCDEYRPDPNSKYQCTALFMVCTARPQYARKKFVNRHPVVVVGEQSWFFQLPIFDLALKGLSNQPVSGIQFNMKVNSRKHLQLLTERKFSSPGDEGQRFLLQDKVASSLVIQKSGCGHMDFHPSFKTLELHYWIRTRNFSFFKMKIAFWGNPNPLFLSGTPG